MWLLWTVIERTLVILPWTIRDLVRPRTVLRSPVLCILSSEAVLHVSSDHQPHDSIISPYLSLILTRSHPIKDDDDSYHGFSRYS